MEGGGDAVVDVFRNGFIGASKSKVVDLTDKENLGIEESAGIDVAFMSGALEAEIVKDATDVYFPESASFGVALKGFLDGDSVRWVEFDVEPGVVPGDEGVVEAEECRSGRFGGVGIGILSIAGEDEEIVGSGKSKEEAKNRMFESRSKGIVDNFVQIGGSTGGTVTAKASTAATVEFDAVVPEGAKEHGAWGRTARRAKHAKGVKLVELFCMCCVPEGPGREAT